MVDARDLKSLALKSVPVRVRQAAPKEKNPPKLNRLDSANGDFFIRGQMILISDFPVFAGIDAYPHFIHKGKKTTLLGL